MRIFIDRALRGLFGFQYRSGREITRAPQPCSETRVPLLPPLGPQDAAVTGLSTVHCPLQDLIAGPAGLTDTIK